MSNTVTKYIVHTVDGMPDDQGTMDSRTVQYVVFAQPHTATTTLARRARKVSVEMTAKMSLTRPESRMLAMEGKHVICAKVTLLLVSTLFARGSSINQYQHDYDDSFDSLGFCRRIQISYRRVQYCMSVSSSRTVHVSWLSWKGKKKGLHIQPTTAQAVTRTPGLQKLEKKNTRGPISQDEVAAQGCMVLK